MLFLSLILTLIGRPLANVICKVRIFKRNIPRGVSAFLTIIIFLLILTAALLFFVPSLVKEVKMISDIDSNMLLERVNIIFLNIQDFLYDNNLMNPEQTLGGVIAGSLKNVFDLNALSNVLSNIISSTGSFLFGLFAVFFITFFLIKDDFRLENAMKVFFNDNYSQRVVYLSKKIETLLSRYCTGIFVKTLCMIIVLYIGFLLLGIKGALLMAFIGGITNIIPYLGPIIGGVICSVFGIINCISVEMYSEIVPVIIKIILMFVGANVIDNWILQPYIYSQSIKAHPVEIFLVTIIAGQLGGMGGMVLGIPVYTIIRIAVTEIYRCTKVTSIDELYRAD